MEEEARYHQFCQSGRGELRLHAAVDALGDEEVPAAHWVKYLEYMKGRKRPAAELLVEQGNLYGLYHAARLEMIEPQAIRTYIKRSVTAGNPEITAYLLQLLNGNHTLSPNTERVRSSSQIAADLWQLARNKIIRERGDRSLALRGLRFRELETLETFGFDGYTVYYNPDNTIKVYKQEDSFLEKAILHMICHGILLHLPLKMAGDLRLWNLACDIQVAGCLKGGLFSTDCSSLYRIYRELEHGISMSQDWKDLEKLEQLYHLDDHRLWRRDEEEQKNSENPLEYQPMKLYETRKLVEQWKGKGHGIAMEESGNTQRMGSRAGKRSQSVTLKKKKTYDYHTFLRQFAVYDEEMGLDMDSFDYIPYWYSRTHYQDIVLLEPLEYQEVRRLEEFVIAIDTSGSCSGQVVQKFLEETYAILTEGKHFFSKMSVYVIQCDSMIQDVVHITCEEEWKDYAANLKVKGLGGTDFRPVFGLVDEKLKSGDLKNLKGMLYFTDGDGIYPCEKPVYETAFVFLNSNYKKAEVPDWALMLNLQLTMENTNGVP